jgi:hypothetical protein
MKKLRAPTAKERAALGIIIRLASVPILQIECDRKNNPDKDGLVKLKDLKKHHITCRKFIASQYSDIIYGSEEFYKGVLDFGEN